MIWVDEQENVFTDLITFITFCKYFSYAGRYLGWVAMLFKLQTVMSGNGKVCSWKTSSKYFIYRSALR